MKHTLHNYKKILRKCFQTTLIKFIFILFIVFQIESIRTNRVHNRIALDSPLLIAWIQAGRVSLFLMFSELHTSPGQMSILSSSTSRSRSRVLLQASCSEVPMSIRARAKKEGLGTPLYQVAPTSRRFLSSIISFNLNRHLKKEVSINFKSLKKLYSPSETYGKSWSYHVINIHTHSP